MPQIWMTYQEIADLLNCDTEMARGITIQRALDRKRSRDGLTRAKLDSDLTARFVAAIRHAELSLNQAVHDLRGMHERMSRSDQTSIRRPATSAQS
ncbi:hypothetical protein [Bradyrhizobium sp. ORS 86]|uniref:hypothetical protein n=1 Tax=Bradyrhizobium sp. ORS 86 TaxID=1685970 RepID=UPI0038901688